MLAAGCGGSDEDAGETTAAPPPPARPEAAHAAPELEALLPAEIDGVALEKASATGAGVFGGDAFSRVLTDFLASAGKEPTDLRFANARDPSGVLGVEAGVFRVEGVDAAALRDAIVEGSRPAAPGLEVSTDTVARRPVTMLAFANGSTLYLYEQDDSVFYVGTTRRELAARVLAALPGG